MPTRELIKRLIEINNWDNIPKLNKRGTKLSIYYKKGRTYGKGIFISYQYDKSLEELCGGNYKGNVLIRIVNGAFIKKYIGKDRIFVDYKDVKKRELKKMNKNYKELLTF